MEPLDCPCVGGGDRVRKSAPADPVIDVERACVWIPPENEKLKEMVALLEERLRRDPGDFWSWDNLANLCFSEGFVLQSIGIYRKALEIRPDLAVTHLRLGIAYYRLARLDDAISELGQALECNPDLAMAHYYLGFAHYHKGHSEESLGHFQKVRQLSPETRIVLYHLAETHLQGARFQQALELLQNLVRFSPDSATAWYKMGLALFGLNRNTEAARAFREALRCNPQDRRSANMVELITDVPDV
ncbi:MAG: tetratricopeptide repeat protein [Elusimicrobia bacterium]|nr:tetratricopeptide repeat protein [Elusimicrobiota bacterium]